MNAYKPLLETCAKALLGLGLIVLSIWALERDGQFEDEYDSNNHPKKRWEYLYHMADAGTPIDIVVLGKSIRNVLITPLLLRLWAAALIAPSKSSGIVCPGKRAR